MKKIATVLLLVLSATLLPAQQPQPQATQPSSDEQELLRLSPSLIVLHSDTFPREHWWRPFHRPPVDLPAIAIGWNNQNPLLQQFLSATGRQPLLRAMCADPSILVVAEEGRLDFVTTYLREHFNASVVWTKVMTGSFPVWRCSLVTRAVSRTFSLPVRSWPARAPILPGLRGTDVSTS